MQIRPEQIAFDIDGVVADTFRTFVRKARQEYGCQVRYQDITEYDFMKVIEIDEQLTLRIFRTLLAEPVASGIKPLDGAVDVLTKLSHAAPLLFVTARPNRDAILEWVYLNLPEVDSASIRLEATETYTAKLPILQKAGIRYFVEDRLDTCFLLEEVSIVPIVYRQPWNEKPHPFHVVDDWDEVAELIAW
jgi:uncharacterized HAD superfamily protein